MRLFRPWLLLIAFVLAATAAAVPAPAEAKASHPKRICALSNMADGVRPGAEKRVAISRSLGITCARNSTSSLTWSGSDPGVQAIVDAGLDLVLNVNNQPPPTSEGASPSVPPTTDAEFSTYKRTLRQIIASFHPKLLTVENEEEASKFFGGTMPQYVEELRSAIDTAHRHQTKVTNGGITSLPTALITWQRLRNHESQAAADDYAQRTFGQEHARSGWAGILNDLLATPYTGLSNAGAQEAWDRANYLIGEYKKPAGKNAKDPLGLDFVNFHWYFADPKALRQSIHVLEHKTNRKVITTEIGQYDRSPTTVTDMLGQAVGEGLQWTVWYDGDGDPAQALHNGDCTLRPNGEAFRDFVVAHPPANTPVPCAPAP